MARLFIAACLFIFHPGNSICQVMLAQWNFNQSNFLPATGTGFITSAGSVATSFSSGNGSTDTASVNVSLSTTGYPAIGLADRSSGIKIHIATTGYQSLLLQFDNRNSNAAANTIVVQYSTDDLAYTDVPAALFVVTNTIFNSHTVNLAAIQAVNNVPDLYLRIVTAFAGTQYQAVNAGAYSSSGTIRFDMISVTGIPVACSGSATIPASGLILIQTADSSATLAFDRGNGSGCIIVARPASFTGIPPANGINYNANAHMGMGSQTGPGNFVVFNGITTGKLRFTVTGLSAGTTYYFSAYEYSSEGFCYLAPVAAFAVTCNSTILTPGDMLITGFDAHIATGGVDQYYLTNIATLRRGTSFSLVNSRFEAGAPGGVRTNKWRGPGSAPYSDPNILTLKYTGAIPLASGSVIGFSLSNDVHNITVNGMSADSLFDLPADNLNLNGGFISTSAPDQLYLVYGYFTAYGTDGVDKYNLLTGNVLCGISNGNNWVAFSGAVSTIIRESRVPPQVNCINMAFAATTRGFAYMKPAIDHAGTKKEIIGRYTNSNNWLSGQGNDNINDALPASNALFTITAPQNDGYWNGVAGNDWFNCSNWDGLSVPSYTTDVIISAAANQPHIDNENSVLAAAYIGSAVTDSLQIMNQAALSFTGNLKNLLLAYGQVKIAPFGSLAFEQGNHALNDTIYFKGDLISGAAPGLGLIAGKGNIVLDGNHRNETTKLRAMTNSALRFNNLIINCGTGLLLDSNTSVEIDSVLVLNRGILSAGANTITLNKNAIIKSPVNLYGETDNGWTGSFIDGTMTRVSADTQTKKFPLGRLTASGIHYAPFAITPANNILKNYTAVYYRNIPPDIFNVNNLDHVSQIEYWDIACNTNVNPDKDAKVTLYWRPYSRVLPGSLPDLRIAHYYDHDGLPWTSNTWSIDANPGSFSTNGTAQYGTITNNLYTTSFSPFTLGTMSANSTLAEQDWNWQVYANGRRVYLGWQLPGEPNVDRYKIEKSPDGSHFKEFKSIPATRSGASNPYQLIDETPAGGWNYYRLIAINQDGSTSSSAIKKVFIPDHTDMRCYPNPASTVIHIEVPADGGSLVLSDIHGINLINIKNPSQGKADIDLTKLAKGLYILNYYSTRYNLNTRIIVS